MKVEYSNKAFIAPVIILALFMCECSANDAVSQNWGVNIPEDCKILYQAQFPEKTFRGDGVFYSVRACETGTLLEEIDGNLVWKETDTAFFKIINDITSRIELDGQYMLDQDRAYKYAMLSKNDGDDLLYLVYDAAESRLIIVERHI